MFKRIDLESSLETPVEFVRTPCGAPPGGRAGRMKTQRARGTPAEELDRRVAKVISAEDECRILLDCRKQKNGKPRVLAVVCPKSPATQTQCALFVMKPRMFNTSKLLLRNIVPILSDFHAEMGEGNSVVIKYSKKNKTKHAVFLSTSPDDLGAFLRVASSAHQIALMHVFTLEAHILKKNSVDCAQ